MQFFKKENILFILNLFLLVVIFIIDLIYPSKIFIWLLYLIPVLITSSELSRKKNNIVAAAASVLIITGFFISRPSGMLEIITILTAAFLIIGLLWITVFLKMQSRESTTSLENLSHLLETIFDEAQIPMAHINTDFKFIKVNEAFAKFDEHQIWEYSNKNYFEAFPEDNNIKDCFEEVIKTGKPYNSASQEVKKRINKNKVTYWAWQIVPVKGSDNSVVGLIVTFNTITERAEIERKLRENQVRLNGIISSAMDAIISIDREQKILLFNNAAEKMFKISAEDALGKHIGMFIPKEFRNVHHEHIKAFGKTNISTRSMNSLGKIFALRTDGNIFPAEASISQVDVNGQKIYSVILRDITERVKTEELNQIQKERALFLSEVTKLLSEYTSNYFEALKLTTEKVCGISGDFCAIKIINDEKLFRYLSFIHSKKDPASSKFNKDFSLLNPAELNDLKTQNSPVVISVEENNILSPEFTSVLINNGMKSVIIVPIISLMQFLGFLFIGKKEEINFIDISEENFLNEFASRIGLHIINAKNYEDKNREIEERKKIQEDLTKIKDELERSNRELEQFAYIASHDMQEPLRMITNYIELLKRRYSKNLDTDANEFIDFAVNGAKRMQRLIKDLLEFSKISTKEKSFEKVDLNKILASVLLNLQVSINEANAKIIYEDLPELIADPSQMEQLFQNLINNAIKFRNEQIPEIKINFSEEIGHYKFSVKDNGTGINPKFEKDIFVIFQRAHESEYSGTGIGLAVVKKIVERHEGKIWFESEYGKGTEFFFTISKNLYQKD